MTFHLSMIFVIFVIFTTFCSVVVDFDKKKYKLINSFINETLLYLKDANIVGLYNTIKLTDEVKWVNVIIIIIFFSMNNQTTNKNYFFGNSTMFHYTHIKSTDIWRLISFPWNAHLLKIMINCLFVARFFFFLLTE